MINIYKKLINYDVLEEYSEELFNNKKYIPISIQNYIIQEPSFYKDMDYEEKVKFRKMRNNLPEEYIDRQEYITNDLKRWVKENPKYKKILK